MKIHDIADEVRRAYPHAVSVSIHVNADEVTVETRHYDGRGDYSMRQLDGAWAATHEYEALAATD
jgi:hypothetical protein